jgi:hypothetical protein
MNATNPSAGPALEQQFPRLRRWLRDPDRLLFAVLLVLHLVPLWWFPFFPSQDGPAHVENADILRNYDRADRPLLRTFYTINSNPDPNWFGHVVLAALMAAVPPLIAEKLLLTGYLFLLPLSLAYALRALRPGGGPAVLLVFPFLHNLFFHMGFYNFCYSLPLFFFALGYWLRHRERFTAARAAVLGGLGLLLFFCHLFSLVALGVLLAVLVGYWFVLDLRTRPARECLASLRSRALVPLCAFLPALLLAVWFLARRPGSGVEIPEEANRLSWLLKLEALVSYGSLEVWPSLGLALFFLVCTGVLVAARARRPQLDAADGFLAAAAVFVALLFVVPDSLAGGLFVIPRLTLYPFFALILWLAARPLRPALAWAIRGAALASTLPLLALHTAAYARLNPYLEEYVTAAVAVESNTTLLPWSYSHSGRGPDDSPLSIRVGPFRHAAGYVAMRRPVVNLCNYEANAGYFPILYRPEVNPYDQMGLMPAVPDRGLESTPPRVDIPGYERTAHQRVDYILVWSAPDPQAALPQLGALGYERIYTSAPRGLAQLYRRKDWGSAPQGRP